MDKPNKCMVWSTVVQDDMEMALDLLLDAGVDVESADKSGKTLLMSELEYGRLECVELLIERGSDTGAEGLDKVSPYPYGMVSADDFMSCKRAVARRRAAEERDVLSEVAGKGAKRAGRSMPRI